MATTRSTLTGQEYEIVKPKKYRRAKAAPEMEAPTPRTEGMLHQVQLPEEIETAPERPPREKRAVWIVHGMGQQIPFETLDSLTAGIRGVSPNGTSVKPRLCSVQFDDQIVQRVELDVEGKNGKPYELHLYEAYWAPVTEGAAKLNDVFSFLFDGAFRGILNSMRSFQRAMFPGAAGTGTHAGNGMQEFRVKPRTFLEIAGVVIVLVSLVWINLVILAAGGSKGNVPGLASFDLAAYWNQLTAVASGMCAMAVTFGVVLFLAEPGKPQGLSRLRALAICVAGWTGFLLTLAAIVLAALFAFEGAAGKDRLGLLAGMNSTDVQGTATVLILCALMVVVLALLLRGFLRSRGAKQRGNAFFVFLFLVAFALNLVSLPALAWAWQGNAAILDQILSACEWLASPMWVWPFLIVVSAQVRTILVEFPGDVAIYVASNKLDRFDKIRKEIKKIAADSARNVYQLRNDAGNGAEYKKVAVVGHSLGSVIAYDTLNRLLTEDDLGGNKLDIAGRTCLLETFGSPLDKVAFFFTIQGKDSYHIREQLAALVQPLIQDYTSYRTFDWVNVFSKNDIVSGRLDFYDLPAGQGQAGQNRVINLEDPDAVTPLAAHVEYWKNKLVWQELYKRVAP